MKDLSVVNIKLSLKLTSIKYQEVMSKALHLRCNERPNFIVLFYTYTYTIFKANALTGHLHCNVTKIKSFSDVPNALKLLYELFPSAEFAA